jgi:hypothetical protein
MADEFERFLGDALAPEPRQPDRMFVARVQARIALDERFRQRQRANFRELGMELVGLAAIAAALLWLGRAQPIANFAADSPGIALAAVLSAFALAVLLFSRSTGEHSAAKVE